MVVEQKLIRVEKKHILAAPVLRYTVIVLSDVYEACVDFDTIAGK